MHLCYIVEIHSDAITTVPYSALQGNLYSYVKKIFQKPPSAQWMGTNSEN